MKLLQPKVLSHVKTRLGRLGGPKSPLLFLPGMVHAASSADTSMVRKMPPMRVVIQKGTVRGRAQSARCPPQYGAY